MNEQKIEVGQVWHSAITNSYMMLVAYAKEDDKVYLSGMKIFPVSLIDLKHDYILYRYANGTLASEVNEDVCTRCNGSGDDFDEHGMMRCMHCKGTGRAEVATK